MRLTDRGVYVLCTIWITVVLTVAGIWFPDLLTY